MSKSKGSRRERQARQHYEAANYRVQPFYGRRYGETDGFNLFDLVAVRPYAEPHFVQVKSNVARGLNGWADAVADLMGGAPARCLYAVCHDREGWRCIEAEAEGATTTVFDGRDADGDMGDALTEWLR